MLAAGFACYSLWRLSEAAFGVTGEGRKAGRRLQSLVRGLIYGFLAYTAVQLLVGSRTPQTTQQKGYAAEVMAHPGGRWVVGLVGVAVAIAGVVMFVEGLRLSFMRYFPAGGIKPATRAWIRQLVPDRAPGDPRARVGARPAPCCPVLSHARDRFCSVLESTRRLTVAPLALEHAEGLFTALDDIAVGKQTEALV